jgi:hypothetical protein
MSPQAASATIGDCGRLAEGMGFATIASNGDGLACSAAHRHRQSAGAKG